MGGGNSTKRTTREQEEMMANQKIREDQLKAKNEKLLQRLKDFESIKKTEIEKLEQRLKDLAKENDKAMAGQKETIQVLQKERDDLARQKDKYKEEIEENDKQFEQLKEQLQQKDDEIKKAKHTEETEDNDKQLEQLEQLKEQLQQKDDEIKKLSEMTGRRLSDDTQNMPDLSDENRPTKLAEKYTELFDNEWTDALSYLQTFEVFKTSEKETIDTLVTLLVEAFQISTKTAQGKLESLREILDDVYGDIPRKNSHVKDIMKQVKDQRKKISSPSQELVKNYKDAISKRLPTLSITMMASDTFKPYIQKCLEICWLMAVQDPPLYLTLENCKKGHDFDNNIFKEYTMSGPFIDFAVWPAAFLEKDGPILCKGVVQCRKLNYL